MCLIICSEKREILKIGKSWVIFKLKVKKLGLESLEDLKISINAFGIFQISLSFGCVLNDTR